MEDRDDLVREYAGGGSSGAGASSGNVIAVGGMTASKPGRRYFWLGHNVSRI